MTLFAKTVAERTRPGQRQDVEEQGTRAGKPPSIKRNSIPFLEAFPDSDLLRAKDYTFHAYGRSEGICGIIISDHAYPALVAHQLLSKVVDDFLSANPRSSWATGTPTLSMPQLKDYLLKYQDPQQADSIMKIQKELDETKIVLHKTIESVLQRGEKLDDLVAKSDGLSAQSKMFYRKSPIGSAPDNSFDLGGDERLTPLFCDRTSQEAELLLSCYVGKQGSGFSKTGRYPRRLSA
jgi:synaptobrevin homolog YKT6